MAPLSAGTFRALRQRNFRLFFVGQVLSVSGTWAQRIGQSWLAYRLSHSSVFLAAVTITASFPAVLLSPVAGVLADRMERRTLLLWAQILAMLQAVALTIAAFRNTVTQESLLLLSLALGIITAFENPARQSFYSELVGPEDMSNAIALNASMMNTARVAGPAAAGLIVAVWGETVCFFLNAISFLAMIVALLLMKMKTLPRAERRQHGLQLLREGFTFISRTPEIATVLMNFAFLNLAGGPYLTLMPVLVAERLSRGPTTLGWLLTASGAGAVCSSLYLASRETTRGTAALSLIATAIMSVALIVLGASRSFPVALIMLLLIGAGYSTALACTQTVIQIGVPEVMRGRAMSFYSLVFLGVPPLGSLVAGIAADHYTVGRTLAAGGALCLLGMFLCLRRWRAAA